jgi:hypothetical protein
MFVHERGESILGFWGLINETDEEKGLREYKKKA